MTVRGIPAPQAYLPRVYWEDRARLFAAEGEGLAAVCSYGMPEFYNRLIHLSQRLALEPWYRLSEGTRVLDIGCGVGRWSRLLAARGARVTGIDISPTMIAEAQRRVAQSSLSHRCRFLVQDLTQLDVEGPFDLITGVTVLQHVLDPFGLRSAITRIVDLLAPGGRIVLLEAAPTTRAQRCDTTIFKARQRSLYLQLFTDCGLQVRAITGVDPAPFKTWLLPYLRRWPRPVSMSALAIATALATPVDALLGRWAVEQSWHAVFVLERAPGEFHAHRS